MRLGVVLGLALLVGACQSSRSPLAVTQGQSKASAAPVLPGQGLGQAGGSGLLPGAGATLIGNDGLGAVDPSGANLIGNDGGGLVAGAPDVGIQSVGKADEEATGTKQAPSVGQAIRPTAAPVPVVSPATR